MAARKSRLKQDREMLYHRTLFLLGLVLVGGFLLWRYPLIGVPKKQYVFDRSGEVEKVPATGAGETKETLVDAFVKGSNASGDVVVGNEFAKWAVLDYYPGGYHVIYPDGFIVSYSPTLFEAVSPAGGKVVVNVSGGSFNVRTDLTGAGADQKPIIEAAARLVSGSFKFLSGSGYDLKDSKARFSQ